LTRDQDWVRSKLGYSFKDENLLASALTHRSAGSRHNERLEFLGDALINFVIALELYRRVPRADEGDLSRLRASLVKGGSLAELARSVSLGDQLKLGSGELKSGGYRRESILADALEAMFGAILLDGGTEAASKAILVLFDERLHNLPKPEHLKDSKTRLQEWLQARNIALPVYAVDEVQGAAHNQRFSVSCQVASLDQVTTGGGTSRRKAEQASAEKMLEILTKESLI
jgi:ribonuclease-3